MSDSETTPAEVTPSEPEIVESKHPLASKTVWVNVVALVSAFLPAVQEWLETNPVEMVSVFVAVNILVRFATKGRISIFGNEAGTLGVCVFALGVAALLPSCAAYGVSGTAFYQDAETGAKGGLAFTEGAPPLPWFWVPVETPDGTGLIEVEVVPTK